MPKDAPKRYRVASAFPAAIAGLLVVGLYAGLDHFLLTPRIAYVNTGKLMVGFSESAKVERDLKVEEEKWQGQLQQLQDTLQTVLDRMSKEYDKSTPARKKELQDILSARNQQINNFRTVNMRMMEESRQKKMQGAFDKANVYLGEYGKKHHYGIIFGTAAGGNIVYGDERRLDVTEEIIKGLNNRYK